VGRLHLRCRSTRLRLMGALSLTPPKPRGRSGLHSTPGLARLVPRRCTPSFHRDHQWIIHSPLWGSIPRGTRCMINRMTGEPIPIPSSSRNSLSVSLSKLYFQEIGARQRATMKQKDLDTARVTRRPCHSPTHQVRGE
jgi:hypothetical protein